MREPLLNVRLRAEDDVVIARQRARYIAQQLQFEKQDQTRIATAVSEIARNAVTYAGGGRAEFFVEADESAQRLTVEVSDKGPGIARLDEVLSGRYRSSTGMGLGIIGAKRLLDACDVRSSQEGTRVTLHKNLPRTARRIGTREITEITKTLEAEVRAQSPAIFEELHLQNRELVKALDELDHLNGELFDTNRGVVALYAELDEKAENLRRADELKTRFLSNMSHEFRTPLNSILALARLLTDQVDGPLSAEQHKQVGYIRRSATELLELVNDLLDLAKVEAGMITVRTGEFAPDDVFAALRGLMRPMLAGSSVELIFEEVASLPKIWSDEAKVTQILRNFLANALKFTESGEIRVTARLLPRGSEAAELQQPCEFDSMCFCVADTGIGIAAADRDRIFLEFSQVESPVQQRVRGTGLGLPLCRKLAAVIGGRVWVESELGVGSRFYLLVPQGTAASSVREAL